MGLFGHMCIHEGGIDRNPETPTPSKTPTMPSPTLASSPCAPIATTTRSCTSSMQSPHLIEGDPSEAVVHVLPCQSWTVSILVTDRAVWCIRNEPQTDAGRQEMTSLMFVIPYRRLDCVRILSQTEAALTQSRRLVSPGQTAVSPSSPLAASSTYVEFLGDGWGKRRLLRFDRQDWALDLLNELNEAHFRFVQTAMTLSRKAQDEAEELRDHPLAMAFAPPLSIMDAPSRSDPQPTDSSPLPENSVHRP
ncbi:Vacuolar protein sorting-associated protein 13D [Sparganum proliferum]